MAQKILDSRKLHLFSEICRTRSFRAAALSLGISQPVLTRQVQALEEDLAVVLLHRGGRGVKPTEAGLVLLERAARILPELEEARSQLAALGARPAGVVTLAMLTSFSAAFSARLLSGLRRKLPEVKLRTIEGTSRFVEENLLSGQADIGILVKRPMAEVFILEDLMQEDFHLFGPSDRLPEAPVTLPQVAGLPLVLPLAPHGTRRLLDDAARRAGTALSGVFEVDSPHLMAELIRTEKVFALLPASALAAQRAQGGIGTVPVVGAPLWEVSMGTLAGRPLSAAARAVAPEIRRFVQRQRR